MLPRILSKTNVQHYCKSMKSFFLSIFPQLNYNLCSSGLHYWHLLLFLSFFFSWFFFRNNQIYITFLFYHFLFFLNNELLIDQSCFTGLLFFFFFFAKEIFYSLYWNFIGANNWDLNCTAKKNAYSMNCPVYFFLYS